MAAVVLAKILRAGEGKMVRRLSAIADHIETLEGDYVDLTDAELRALTDTFKERYGDGESLDDLLPEAFAVVREAARRTLGQFHYKVQLMGGTALHLGNIAEMKTGEGKTLVATLPAYLNALQRRRRARRHGQRLPGHARRRLDGPGPPLPRPVGRQDPRPAAARAAPRRLRLRHHLRHQQRVRLRLPARQHGLVARRPGAARAQLRDRRRGRLDPDRRGPHPADHQRPGRGEPALVPRVRPARAADEARRPLRGRRGQAHRRGHRRGRRVRRGRARHGEPVRGGEHPAGRLPEQRPEGQGAVQDATATTSSPTARCSSSTSSPAACCTAAGSTRACTRRSRPRKACRSSTRTRRSPRSPCRTTSGSTRSSRA